ncbi:MAG: NACHT domain-containing protein, partial [Chloroflexi bacterium]
MVDRVGQQLGHYRLLRVLGQGSFAAVYLGEHQYLERPAAIKVLHVRMEPGKQEAFRREARTIAQLSHPHIIGVHDFGIEDQTPYLAMEYTPNGTLRARHPSGSRLSFEQIISYVKQIASALDYAHTQYVIHRDVKPENILLNAKHELVLSDFGLAVAQPLLNSLSTQNLAGTPLYMAPEQIRGKPCAASDQYALGVIVYEWLCGEVPFRGTLYEVLDQHLNAPPPGLCERLPQLPQAAEDAVLGALAKDPQHRFPTVQDFATVLSETFFATQSLALNGSFEHRIRDEVTHFVSTSEPSEQDSTDGVSQPRLKVVKSAEEKPEQILSTSSQLPMPGQTTSKTVRSSLAQTNRQRLLRRVRSFWITGVLEQSLHGAALMALGLEKQPDAVANPWHLVVQQPDTAPCSLPEGTRITQVYDDADGELLILGAPGAGKTTLLLELARDLLERAEQDEQHPMPVLFNLSSWAMKPQSLVDWLIEELSTKYQVPRKLGQALVTTDQILPLLDGLDEVATKDRGACIEAINAYRQEHGLLPLAVCSRSADYLAQTTRVLLRSAVVVQPLSGQQIENYLRSAGPQVEALLMALRQDSDLQELATTPLMLNLLLLAYQGMSRQEIAPLGTLLAKQQQVFATYVQRMLHRQGTQDNYTSQQTMHWLAYLARQMKQENQTEFYIEGIQPSWLEKSGVRRLYFTLITGFLGALFAALIAGIVSGILSTWTSYLLRWVLSEYSPQKWHSSDLMYIWGHWLFSRVLPNLYSVLSTAIGGLLVGLVGGLLVGLAGGLLVGLLNIRETKIKPLGVIIWSWETLSRDVVVSLLIGCLCIFLIGCGFLTGLVGNPVGVLITREVSTQSVAVVAICPPGSCTTAIPAPSSPSALKEFQSVLKSLLSSQLISGVIFGFVGGLVSGFLGGKRNDY